MVVRLRPEDDDSDPDEGVEDLDRKELVAMKIQRRGWFTHCSQADAFLAALGVSYRKGQVSLLHQVKAALCQLLSLRRQEMESKRKAARTKLDEEDADVSGQNLVCETDGEQELAATRIQSRVRGKQARPWVPSLFFG